MTLPTVQPSSGSRLSGIEGMRAVAASSILVYHVWLYSFPGRRPGLAGLDHLLPDFAFGVTLFFTLSGFLLYRPFAAAIVRDERLPRIAPYLRNRALRILPAYWVILAVCALVAGSALQWQGSRLHNGYVRDLHTLINDALLVQTYDRSTIITGIGPAWSLTVEVAFYLVLPVLAVAGFMLGTRAGSRSGRRVAALTPPAVLLALGFLSRLVAEFVLPQTTGEPGWDPTWHSVLVRSFLVQSDLFAFGMALAILRVDAEDGSLSLPRWWPYAAATTALAAYALTTYRIGNEQLGHSPANTLMAFACALALALVVLPRPTGRPSRMLRLLESKPFVATGVVSYSLFLWHEPVVRWLAAHGFTRAGGGGFLLNLLGVALISGALSWITYRAVERPALRRKRRTVRTSAPSPTAPPLLEAP